MINYNRSYNPVSEISFSYSGDFDPSIITEKLLIKPDKLWRKGEENIKLGIPLSSGWALISKFSRSDIISGYQCIDHLLSRFHNKRKCMENIYKAIGVRPCLSLWICLESGEEFSISDLGFSFEAVNFLGKVGASIDIDIREISK